MLLPGCRGAGAKAESPAGGPAAAAWPWQNPLAPQALESEGEPRARFATGGPGGCRAGREGGRVGGLSRSLGCLGGVAGGRLGLLAGGCPRRFRGRSLAVEQLDRSPRKCAARIERGRVLRPTRYFGGGGFKLGDLAGGPASRQLQPPTPSVGLSRALGFPGSFPSADQASGLLWVRGGGGLPDAGGVGWLCRAGGPSCGGWAFS